MLEYGFFVASAVGATLVLRALARNSPRALGVALLCTVGIPVLTWRLALSAQEFPVTSYLVAACSLAATIVVPSTLGHFSAALLDNRTRLKFAVAVGIALVLWIPIVMLGGFIGTCGLDVRCDP
jgi:hypothetical protein